MGSSRRHRLPAAILAGMLACAAPAHAQVVAPDAVYIPGGAFLTGSDRAEREAAYRLDEQAYGHDATRMARWYENELPPTRVTLPAFFVTRTPITNAQYLEFVAATGHRSPSVDAKTWAGYGLNHPYATTRRHAWNDRRPPPDRLDHPVVLVSHGDAIAYAGWLSRLTGRTWRLPTEEEWEKAARGTDGRAFPWGNVYDPANLDSADAGPFDTVAVARYPAGNSPYGVSDAAGLVFEWTATPMADGRYVVKGGSWDDKGCGVCRPAARHSRPEGLKHIIIGFRLVREVR